MTWPQLPHPPTTILHPSSTTLPKRPTNEEPTANFYGAPSGSPGGLRLRAEEGLSLGDSLVVEVHSRYCLTGSIVWLQHSEFGFACRYPLNPGDPLVTAAQAAAKERDCSGNHPLINRVNFTGLGPSA
jgi:hypothetical protein